VWASDGDCDDGGPGSEYTGTCSLGTDCTDCGTRDLSALPADRSYLPKTLEDGYNGDCDDGGPGSEYVITGCTYGGDCTDCGPRPWRASPPLIPP
ncbi:hypothetical protein Ctob_016252, partial [Chrysochromulina tobinii]